jgi:SAM-dependent methyltransferase
VINHRLALASIFAISLGLLVDEIMLSAIFHVLLGAGNTVAAIAIALVGLSAGGLLAYIVPVFHDPAHAERLLRASIFWFGIALLASVFLIMAVPISHGDLIYARGDLGVQLWKLAIYHITVAPFLIGGVAISVLFRSDPSRIGTLYRWDLLGAALGCVASPVLLGVVGAPHAILVGAIPAVLLGSWLRFGEGGGARAWVLLPLALLVLSPLRPELLTFATLNTMGEVENARYRSFPIEHGDISYERWALDAWTIIRSDRIPQQWENFEGWGLSSRYEGPLPSFKLVNYNARFSTYVTRPGDDATAFEAWLDSDLSSIHHLIGRTYRTVLNIGAGGGREVLAALHHGASRVVAVDVSEVVVDDIMKGQLREFSRGLYLDPRVEAIADEGRTFTERSSETFDLIEFSIVGGMNLEKMDLVRVDDLFTREALQTYVGRLSDDGLFSYGMYTTRSDIVEALLRDQGPPGQPYIPALRTLTGLRLAMEERAPEIDFSQHVLIAALPGRIDPRYDLVHMVASVRPFSDAERARFLETCDRLDFSVYHPLRSQADEIASSNAYTLVTTTQDLGSLAESLRFSLWPSTDDRPFNYAMDANHLRRALQDGSFLRVLSGNPLISMGVSIGLLSLVLMLVPLIATASREGGPRLLASSWSLLLYFACIGFAYMAVEIVALLRLQSYLGKPIYGLSVGLFAFLLSSGMGSGFSQRLDSRRTGRAVHRTVGLVVLVGAAFSLGAGELFEATISATLPLRIFIAVAAIFPLAFLMGMLFPLGMRLVSEVDEELIPWAWATNGCFSVLGIFGTRILALFLGFSSALLLGLLVYAAVSVCVLLHSARPAGNSAGATSA